jgi:hypothetical protein
LPHGRLRPAHLSNQRDAPAGTIVIVALAGQHFRRVRPPAVHVHSLRFTKAVRFASIDGSHRQPTGVRVCEVSAVRRNVRGRLRLDPAQLIRAVEVLTWYNRELGLDANASDCVSRDERGAFIAAVAGLQWADSDPARPVGRE